VLAVAFSPTGPRLATLSADNLVRIYSLQIEDLRAMAARVTRPLTASDCQTYQLDAPCMPEEP
jgi:hypothetical protein